MFSPHLTGSVFTVVFFLFNRNSTRSETTSTAAARQRPEGANNESAPAESVATKPSAFSQQQQLPRKPLPATTTLM